MMKTILITLLASSLLAAGAFKAGAYYESQIPVSRVTVARLAMTMRDDPDHLTVCESIAYDAVLWHEYSHHEMEALTPEGDEKILELIRSRCSAKLMDAK